MRIHLKIPLGAFTGYGRDGIDLTKTLLSQGHHVTVMPLNVAPPIPPEVALVLCEYPEWPVDISLHHLSPDNLGINEEHLKRSYFTAGWTMWEFNGFGSREEAQRERLKNYPHIFAYDETSRDALSTVYDGSLSILQGGYSPDFWSSEAPRDWLSDELRLVMAGALGPRKNPYVAAEAVRQLKEEGVNVRLTLKCSSIWDIHPVFDQAYKDCVTVIRDPWTDSQMKELFERSHIYIGTSWGEGKNLPALEAGTAGCALLLSDCGGHRQWAAGMDYAVLMPGYIEEHEKGLGSVRLPVETVKKEIARLYEDRATLRMMGERASIDLPRQMSWDTVTHRLFAAINAL